MSDGTVSTASPSGGTVAEPAFVADNIAPLANYFGVENTDGKLSTIFDYLRGDKKEYTDIDLLSDLRGTIQKLGAPALNETVVDQVYRYAKIQKQIDSLQQEQKGLLR